MVTVHSPQGRCASKYVTTDLRGLSRLRSSSVGDIRGWEVGQRMDRLMSTRCTDVRTWSRSHEEEETPWGRGAETAK